MNLTLAALYGEKPPELESLIFDAQGVLAKGLGGVFRPYSLEQVHSTIIGLEGIRIPDCTNVANENYLQLKQQLKLMNLRRALDITKESRFLPLTIRIGGYGSGELYPFTSRNQHPYLRSFSFQDDVAVAMGWPVEGGRFPTDLDRLRRSFNEANILHKYHLNANDVDNDLFFVLGRIDRSKTNENTLQTIQERMRDFMAVRPPTLVRVDQSSLFVVGYVDPQLPPEGPSGCVRLPIYPAPPDPGELVALYREA